MARGSAFNLRIFDTTGATSGAVTVCERRQSDARGMTQSPLPTAQEPPPDCRHAGFYSLATGCLQKRETRNHQGGTRGEGVSDGLGVGVANGCSRIGWVSSQLSGAHGRHIARPLARAVPRRSTRSAVRQVCPWREHLRVADQPILVWWEQPHRTRAQYGRGRSRIGEILEA